MTLDMSTNLISYTPESNKKCIAELMDMLSYMRPAFSKHDKRFIERYIAPTGAVPDEFGNYILRIGTAPIMWSCHTDTVHDKSGYLTPIIDSKTMTITANSNADCLGADCTAGVWLMREMIKAKVEGLYIFHRSEETGGLGATFISEKTPEVVKDIKFAIAFDRQDHHDIITHQLGKRSCSNSFAEGLADILSSNGLFYEKDTTGVFTDTAFYTEIIPECTNISVGYKNQHRPSESLDVRHLFTLRDVLTTADFSYLNVERDCCADNSEDYEDIWANFFKKSSHADTMEYTYESVQSESGLSILDVVYMYPHRIAEMFKCQGFNADELIDELERY